MTKYVTLSVRDEEYREITRTMRTTDKLHTLIDFYYDMVPAVAYGEGAFLHRGEPVDRMKTPADYGMRDRDELAFSSQIDSSTFLTLTVREEEGLGSFSLTLRTTDQLRDLMDFCYEMVPTVDYGDGVFLFNGRRVKGHRTPEELGMVDGDWI
uniref:Ubiquitin-like domain-containing protein n=3 Tax=Setaria TaxID=4554 RepID=K4A329_SETIT